MEKINNISILLTFLGLWVTSMFSGRFEILFGFMLIFSFGILHGSNDILLINKLSDSKTKYPFFKVLITYLFTISVVIILFYFFPIIALLLFILFSAYHFGEQHWEFKNLINQDSQKEIFYVIYGLFILFLLFVLNKTEVIEVIQSITHYTMNEHWIDYLFVVIATLLIVFKILFSVRYEDFRTNVFKEIFFLVIFTVVFKVATLIWGFAIYFILWHSIPSLFEQVIFIYGDFKRRSLVNYTLKALPYWLISIIGIVIVYFIFKEEQIFYAIFFSFIAAVTFPHSIVMNKMFRNKKSVTK